MRLFELKDEDYHGEHTAPVRDGRNSIDDLADIYPDDIYNLSVAARYYGHGEPAIDNTSVNIISGLRNKPNKTVTIYRAVPHEPTTSEQLVQLNKEMAAYLKRHTVPASSTFEKGSDWYDDAYKRKAQLEITPDSDTKKLLINPGDWVTINRQYAKQHGQDNLNNKFKIVSKKVKAKEIVTDAGSIHEWGYAP